VVLEFAQVRVEAVADLGFEQTAEALDRVEFRAVGREPQVGAEPAIGLGQMEAGLILDRDMQGGRIGVGDLFEEKSMDVPVDGRGKQKFARVGPVHFVERRPRGEAGAEIAV